MTKYTQTDQLLALTTPLGPDALLPVSLRGVEAISRLFEFELELVAPIGPPLAFDRILGQSVSLELRQGDGGRWFHGIVSRFGETGKDQTFTSYRARLSPRMWLLTRTRRSRVFQRMTTQDILRRVLTGIETTFSLIGAYPARNYCVQYDESDFDFASRLMEEDGIWYAFSHAADRHVLHVSDDVSSCPRLRGGRGVAFGTGAGRASEDWQVSAWEKTQELRAVRCVVRDHSFERPDDPLEATRPALESVRAGAAAHRLRLPGTDEMELYEYPGRYAKLHDKVAAGGGAQAPGGPGILESRDRLVRTRMEAEECASLRIEGAGNCGAFTPGLRFDLRTSGDAAGTYLLTHVDHAATNGGFGAGDETEASYANSFACRPALLPHRPTRVTPRPSIPGFQTATVVGPPGEELFCDRHGRVKVQFHWDREGRHDADSSCWLRVAQVWAGKGWGAFFWPRVGHEVVVVFEDGDPDCPMIVGSVYNAVNVPPYAMPAGKQLGGIRSASVRGAARQNFNSVVFNDEKGEEHLAVHSERNLSLNAEYDTSMHGGRNRAGRVGNSSIMAVGTLPGGGSGGGQAAGGGSGGSNPVYVPPPVSWAPGLNSVLVVGENMQAALGLNHQVAFGCNQQICVNPVGLFAGTPAADLSQGILGGTSGNMQVAVGTTANVTMGPAFAFNIGPKDEKKHQLSNIQGDFGYGEHTLTSASLDILAGLVPIYLTAHGILMNYTTDFVACGNLTLAYQSAIDVLLEIIMLNETLYQQNSTEKNRFAKAFFKGPSGERGDPALKALTGLSFGLAAIIATSLHNDRMRHEQDNPDG